MRLIDADVLVKNLELMAKFQPKHKQSTILGVCATIRATPTIDAEPVRHGRWIDRGDYVTTAYGSLDLKVCSNCNAEVTIDQYDYYCPNCGTKMDEEK